MHWMNEGEGDKARGLEWRKSSVREQLVPIRNMIRAYVFPDNRDNERDRGIRSNVRCNRERERERAP